MPIYRIYPVAFAVKLILCFIQCVCMFGLTRERMCDILLPQNIRSVVILMAKPANDTAGRCVHCGHSRVWGHGRTSRGHKRFICTNCSRTFTLHTGKRLHRIRLREERIRFARLVMLGHSVRQDARILGISPSTVWRWRHEWMRRQEIRAQNRPRHFQDKAVLIRHQLLNGRTFWGQLSNRQWAERHQLDYLDLIVRSQHDSFPAPAIHFTVSTPEPSGSAPSFSVIAEQAPTAALDALDFATEAYALEGSWLVPLSAEDLIGGIEKGSTGAIRWEGRGSPLYAECRATQGLQLMFCRWMARFRGVAVKHLGRYVAWFEAALASGYVAPPKWWDPAMPRYWRPA